MKVNREGRPAFKTSVPPNLQMLCMLPKARQHNTAASPFLISATKREGRKGLSLKVVFIVNSILGSKENSDNMNWNYVQAKTGDTVGIYMTMFVGVGDSGGFLLWLLFLPSE